MIAPGIAARAVQITLTGDAGDKERGDMISRVLRLSALFGRRFACGAGDLAAGDRNRAAAGGPVPLRPLPGRTPG